MFTDPLTQLTNDNKDNLVKYQKAGSIASSVLNTLVNTIKTASSPTTLDAYTLCKTGDALILQHNTATSTNIGIAFPTTICLNNTVGNYTPSAPGECIIKDGDLVKIKLGVHYDNFPALIEYTLCIGNTQKALLTALSKASKKVLKTLTYYNTNFDTVNTLKKSTKKFNLLYSINNPEACNILSYQMSKYVIDDSTNHIHQIIMPRYHESYDYELSQIEFEENEVYYITISISTGTGKINKSTTKPTTIYKKTKNKPQSFNMKSSRNAMNKFKKTLFPINVEKFTDSRFKLGISQCVKKNAIKAYDVYEEKPGTLVGSVGFTVIIKGKALLLAGRPIEC